MSHSIHMALPTPYYEDHEQLLAAFNQRFNAWAPTPDCPPQIPQLPQLPFPGAEQFAAALNQAAYSHSFKMPSPPVSPSLSGSGSSFSADMSNSPSTSSSSGFVSLANITPPRNDTVFGWNSVSVAQAEDIFGSSIEIQRIGRKSAEQTLNPVLHSRNTLKRPASPSPTPSLLSSTSSTSPAPMSQPEVRPLPSAAPKRARTQISSKDFIPPDVSGLSKREARLVKNRAAAFLSRQRKREEFEELEKHCQELERENASLRAGIAHSPSKKLKSSDSEPPQDVLAELARLRESNAQLAAQNAQLSAQNAQLTAENARLTQRGVHPKVEDEDNTLLLSEPLARREKESKEKHGTGSVALMVLMISLSLLGKPLASGVNNARARTAPMSLHTPSAPQPSSTFDFVLPRTNSDYEWLTSPTELDHDEFAAIPTTSLAPQSQPPTTRTLTVQGLENLEIPTDIRDFNFAMDVDERDARNVVLAVSNTNPSSSSSSSGMSTISSPSSASVSTLDSAWPEPSVDSTMAMLGGDYMSYDYDSDIFGASLPASAPKRALPIPGTRRMTVAVVPPSEDGQGQWSVEVKESI